jgi:hypothetical protein
MFCSPEQIENNFSQMSCEESMLQEILAMISLVFSLFVITISVKKLKKNLMNILIIQILISEMIDEINIILNIFTDVQGPVSFENYHGRMVFCYSQIFIAVFSCLWTLTASFFISFKLYDIIMNKNKIYSDGSFMSKYTPLISIICPGIVSYIIWFIQILAQSGQFDFEKTYEKSKRAPPKHFRMGFCWVYTGLSVVVFVIAIILIFGSFYFSLYKGFCFIKNSIISIVTYCIPCINMALYKMQFAPFKLNLYTTYNRPLKSLSLIPINPSGPSDHIKTRVPTFIIAVRFNCIFFSLIT